MAKQKDDKGIRDEIAAQRELNNEIAKSKDLVRDITNSEQESLKTYADRLDLTSQLNENAKILATLSVSIDKLSSSQSDRAKLLTEQYTIHRDLLSDVQTKYIDVVTNSNNIADNQFKIVDLSQENAKLIEAMVDLENAIAALSPKQKERFFANGSKFLNLEVLYPETANVVPYGATQLRIHHIKEYDKAGNVVGEDIQAAHEFEGALRQVEAQNQKTYEIKITDPVTIRKSADFVKQKEELLKILKDVVGKRALKMDDKLGLYFQAWWKEYITNTGKQYGYNIEDTVLQQLINRWAFGNKETNIRVIRDAITNEDFKTWAVEFDKRDYAMQNKIAASPIENLFLKLGVYTLRNIENLVSLNPNDSVRQMKKELKSAVNQIKVSGETDANALDFLKRELTRLKDIGGYNAILPTEGIVFKYNGKLFKLTGAFAPINQLIGYMKFG